MNKLNRLIVVAACYLSLTAFTSAQELLTNGGFENQPNYGSGAAGNNTGFSAMTGTQMPGWTVVAGHAATVHGPPAVYPIISGSYSINMDGEGFGGHNADFYQDFATLAGGKYTLGFDYQGWTNNAPNTLLRVSVMDLATSAMIYNQTFAFNAALIHISQLLALGNGDAWRLEIQESPESGFNDNQFIVDNFSVIQQAPAAGVPESASTIALLSIGLSALVRLRRRLG
ncbi:MAG TPA: DUF642 domain-containing protein [Chthoniobacterales bacterium]|jgi:hypothetical protein